LSDDKHTECGRCFGSGRDNSPGGLGPVNPNWNDANPATAAKIRTYFAKGKYYNWNDENHNANGCEHSCDPMTQCHWIGGCSQDVDGGGYVSGANWGVPPTPTETPWANTVATVTCYDYSPPTGSPVFSKGGGTSGSPIMFKDINTGGPELPPE
jgi:hypothetical protein